jgi:hypothetical protein
VLEFDIDLWDLMDNNNGDCVNFGWEHLPSLGQVRGAMYCSDVYWDAALAALRNACEAHPNHPALNLHKPITLNLSADPSHLRPAIIKRILRNELPLALLAPCP